MDEIKRADIPALIARLDGLNASGREAEAQRFLERELAAARSAGDWRGELTLLSELLGQYRRSGDDKKGLAAVGAAERLIDAHGMGESVSGATVLLNAATTLKCFGQAERSLRLFGRVLRVYSQRLDSRDYRFAGLYNNMALSYAEIGDGGNAEGYLRLALEVLEHCPGSENELAVTLCNLAELYDRADHLDGRIGDSLERAWACLNAPALPRDGYHAFTISKCAPSFDRLGYFAYAGELRRRAKEIYGHT